MRYILSVCCVGLIFCGGCGFQHALGLRFEPSEAQKQTAELTHDLACKVNEDGTDPGSEASRKLVDGTATGLSYIGRPDTVPSLDEFDTVNEEAASDAADRPSVGGFLDLALEIGLGIAGLTGGAAGIKLATGLRRLHTKAKGFTEVVANAERFKGMVSAEVWKLFKDAQGRQTDATRKLVAEETIKIG